MPIRREVLGPEYVDASMARADEFMMSFQRATTSWAWGWAWGDPTLDRKTRSLMNLAMLTALNRAPEIKLHVKGALNNGVTVEEIKAALLHATAYCGIPAGLDAFRAAHEVLVAEGVLKKSCTRISIKKPWKGKSRLCRNREERGMKNLTRRSVLRGSAALAATGALARPHIANAAATTATVWWTQGFIQSEDAHSRLAAAYRRPAATNWITASFPLNKALRPPHGCGRRGGIGNVRASKRSGHGQRRRAAKYRSPGNSFHSSLLRVPEKPVLPFHGY